MASYERNNWKAREIKVDETIIQNPQNIAKEFNKPFTSAERKLTRKIPNNEKIFQDFLTSHNEKMQFEELNLDEFEEALKSLKRNKAADFDDLRSNIIINTYDSLKNILLHVFKVLVQQGIFCYSLKISKVTPIFKAGDKDNVSKQ